MKRNIQFFLFFFIVLASTTNAQIAFQKTYGSASSGSSYGYSVQQTLDGGYIIGGKTFDFGAGGFDAYLIKTNIYGDTLWTKTFGDNGNDEGWSVKQTLDSGYILLGNNSNLNNAYLIKTTQSGDLDWSKAYSGSGYDVQQTSDSGYIFCGSSSTGHILLVKTNTYGDTLWTRSLSGFPNEITQSVKQTLDGGYIVTGAIANAGNNDVYLVRTDFNGNIIWSKNYGGIRKDYGSSVSETSDSGFVILGTTNSFQPGDTSDVYLIKTNINGDTLWTKTFGGMHYDYGKSIQQTSDDGYILTGITFSFGGGNLYLIKTDVNGDTLWTKTYGNPYYYGYSVQQTSDNGYIICGVSLFSGVYLIKTDSNGISGCNEGYTTTIVGSPPTQVFNPITSIVTTNMIVTTPATLVSSGANVTTLCSSTGINETASAGSFIIYPNPAKDYFTIYSNTEIRNIRVEIFNVFGEKVLKKNINTISDNKIHFNNSSQGIYFVKVFDGQNRYSKKLIVE